MWHGKHSVVLLDTVVHPVPPAPVPGGSLSGWIWFMVVLALVLAGGMVLSSRR